MNKKIFALTTVAGIGLAIGAYSLLSDFSATTPGESFFGSLGGGDHSHSGASNDSSVTVVEGKAEDPEQVLLQALNSGDAQREDAALMTVLPDWVQKNPLAAAKFVQSIQTGDLRNKALRILAQKWGDGDAKAALAWSSQLADPLERETFTHGVCLGLAVANPEAAVHLAVDSRVQETSLLEDLTQQWAEKESTSATAWAEKEENGDLRDGLLERIALVVSKTHPSEAASLVIGQIPEGPVQTEAVISVIHQWGERDPKGASAWVEQFPDGPVKERALNELDGLAANSPVSR